MKDIAIQYEKVMINDEWFLFKPVGVVKGTYMEEEELFETDHGTVLNFINGYMPDETCYFGVPTSIGELKKAFGNVNEEALLSEYFYVGSAYCIIGYYNGEQIETLRIPFDSAEMLIENGAGMYSKESTSSLAKFSFDEKAIKELRNMDSLEKIQNYLDDLLRIKDNIVNGAYYTSNGNIKYERDTEENSSPKKLNLQKEQSKKFNLGKLKKTVLSNIIGQDGAVEAVTTALVVNQNSKNPRHKSHLLIAGPSGTGKTEMINIITKELGVPCFKADATAYTKEGYVGKSVYSMLLGLIDAAGGDIEKAQNGVLIVDEIDKKATKEFYDVSGPAVLNSMLKMMDRGIIELDKQCRCGDSKMSFDTSNLTIIFMGAFTGILDKKLNSKNIGFGKNNFNTFDIELTEQDFLDYGMTSEFMGRIPILTFTNKLSVENLIKILKQSKISPLKIEKEYFKELGVKLTYTSDYIERVAKQAEKSNFGARELSKIVRKSLIDVYAETLLDKKISEIKLIGKTLDNPKVYRKKYNKR